MDMLIARLSIPVLVAAAIASCSGVKQKQPPRIPDDTDGAMTEGSGSDMAATEPDTIEVAKDDGPRETEAEKRTKCCQQCVDGLADDKSGDPPGAIPCTKLTTKMEARCVVWHDKNPMTGKEAQLCVEEGGGEEGGGEEGGEEGDGATLE